MPKTFRKKNTIVTRKKNTIVTRKNRPTNISLLVAFQKEITVIFLEVLLMIKLYHWKTTSYATHKATDELYAKLNSNIDSFIEILLGKTAIRTNLTDKRTIRLLDLTSLDELKREIENFKSYLVGLNNNSAMKTMSNTDLFNIRDTILGDMNQLLYLLTLK